MSFLWNPVFETAVHLEAQQQPASIIPAAAAAGQQHPATPIIVGRAALGSTLVDPLSVSREQLLFSRGAPTAPLSVKNMGCADLIVMRRNVPSDAAAALREQGCWFEAPIPVSSTAASAVDALTADFAAVSNRSSPSVWYRHVGGVPKQQKIAEGAAASADNSSRIVLLEPRDMVLVLPSDMIRQEMEAALQEERLQLQQQSPRNNDNKKKKSAAQKDSAATAPSLSSSPPSASSLSSFVSSILSRQYANAHLARASFIFMEAPNPSASSSSSSSSNAVSCSSLRASWVNDSFGVTSSSSSGGRNSALTTTTSIPRMRRTSSSSVANTKGATAPAMARAVQTAATDSAHQFLQSLDVMVSQSTAASAHRPRAAVDSNSKAGTRRLRQNDDDDDEREDSGERMTTRPSIVPGLQQSARGGAAAAQQQQRSTTGLVNCADPNSAKTSSTAGRSTGASSSGGGDSNQENRQRSSSGGGGRGKQIEVLLSQSASNSKGASVASANNNKRRGQWGAGGRAAQPPPYVPQQQQQQPVDNTQGSECEEVDTFTGRVIGGDSIKQGGGSAASGKSASGEQNSLIYCSNGSIPGLTGTADVLGSMTGFNSQMEGFGALGLLEEHQAQEMEQRGGGILFGGGGGGGGEQKHSGDSTERGPSSSRGCTFNTPQASETKKKSSRKGRGSTSNKSSRVSGSGAVSVFDSDTFDSQQKEQLIQNTHSRGNVMARQESSQQVMFDHLGDAFRTDRSTTGGGGGVSSANKNSGSKGRGSSKHE